MENAGSQVLTTEVMKSPILWDTKPHSLRPSDISEEHVASIFRDILRPWRRHVLPERRLISNGVIYHTWNP
jgi:hypothetical protein